MGIYLDQTFTIPNIKKFLEKKDHPKNDFGSWYTPAKKVGLEVFHAVIAHSLIPVFYFHQNSRVGVMLLAFYAVLVPFDNAGK